MSCLILAIVGGVTGGILGVTGYGFKRPIYWVILISVGIVASLIVDKMGIK